MDTNVTKAKHGPENHARFNLIREMVECYQNQVNYLFKTGRISQYEVKGLVPEMNDAIQQVLLEIDQAFDAHCNTDLKAVPNA